MFSVIPLNIADSGQKKIVIHIPMKVKSHVHTHTVYKHIHHGSKVQYKVLGYQSGHMDEDDDMEYMKYYGSRFRKMLG